AAADPDDGEAAFGRVPAASRLDLGPAPEALSGLRVVQDRVRGVDRVLSVGVSAVGGRPVLLYPGPGLRVTVHGLVHLPAHYLFRGSSCGRRRPAGPAAGAPCRPEITASGRS